MIIGLNKSVDLQEATPEEAGKWLAENVPDVIESLLRVHNLEMTVDLVASAIDRGKLEEASEILKRYYQE